MKLMYSGNASKGSVEYSIDAGSTFVPVTLADLKNGVELITNDLANIRVRAGSNVFENISVLKQFKVVETEDKEVLATLEEKYPSGYSVGLHISKAPNNFDSSNTYSIFVGDDCIEFTFDNDTTNGFKVYDYSNNSRSYKYFDEIVSLLSNNSDEYYKLYTGEYREDDYGERSFSKFIDTGYILKITDNIPYEN